MGKVRESKNLTKKLLSDPLIDKFEAKIKADKPSQFRAVGHNRKRNLK